MSIKGDANALLSALAQWEERTGDPNLGHYSLEAEEVHRKSFGQWPHQRFNDAIQLLLKNGYIEDDDTIGSHPYEMNTLTLTVEGRLSAEAAGAAEGARTLNIRARQLLAYLHRWYLKGGGRPFFVHPNEETRRETGLDEAAFGAAARRLMDRQFAKWAGQGITITPVGAQAAESPAWLDSDLPISRDTPSEPEAVKESMQEGSASGLIDIDQMVVRLAFLREPRLKAIVARDLRELELALQNRLDKASLILSGSLLEAVLLDVLDRRADIAGSYMGKHAKWPTDASLKQLVEIAGSVDLEDAQGRPARFLSQSAVGTCNAIMDHRDLVHPHAEVRSEVKVNADVVVAMVGLLRVVVGELSEAQANGLVETYEKL